MKPGVIGARRSALPLLLASALAACSGSGEPVSVMTIGSLDTLEVRAADHTQGRAWDGVVEAVRQATLSAQTSGRVAEVLHDVNDRTAEGAVLVRLSAVEQQAGVDTARAQLRAAEAVAAEAEGNYRRYLELSQAHHVSKAQLDQMQRARDSAFATRDAARAQLAAAGQQTRYTTIRAPWPGIVSRRDVEPGESVGVGQPLMTLFSPDALRVEVGIPQSDAAEVRARPRADLVFDDGRRVEAAEVIVFPAADPATHTVRVRVQLPPLDPVPVPGTTAKVVFPALGGATYAQVPLAALIRRGEVNAVYVLTDGRLSLRQVRLGEHAGDRVDVIAGLRPGEAIAADPVAAAQALAAARKGMK
ncbi:MAG: efflux RND transporter periplasmic adaptor subunit [Dokdonella sp.]|nr:efflux RND transporter periplasmic adaptor subunit [Dokdonella sp.]